MDETVFVILLLTGFCVPSASFPNVYYFVREETTWDEAEAYCTSEHTDMAQIHSEENVTTMMNTPTWGHTDKAWIGLYENSSKWFWVDDQLATYFNWETGQPDNVNANEFCVAMNNNGSWKDCSCSEVKRSVCFNGNKYTVTEEMTWYNARNKCEDQQSTLATIPDEHTNSAVQERVSQLNDVWIGLRRPKLWSWSETGGSYNFMNWQHGQPDNLNGGESCAALVVKDGTWTDEQCNATYPFFCYGSYKSWKTVVRMKMQSSANMEDPACRANLQKQMHAAFANQGLTDFKLTWKKLPVKETQDNSNN